MPRTAALLAVLAVLLAACGDERPAATTSGGTRAVGAHEPDTAPTAPHPIRFVDGLVAGQDAAGGDDALMFVYLGRHHPT